MISNFLGDRLKAVALEIGRVDTVADIGTDHGKLPLYLLKNSLAKRVIAVDISESSLKKAKILCEKGNVYDNIDYICCDGLRGLNEIPDVIVIAGMGGNEIVKIMEDRPISTKFILVPHQDVDLVRRFLPANGFDIVKDYVVFEKKYYEILVAQPGSCVYSEDEIYCGKNMPPSEYYLPRLKYRYEKINRILTEQNIAPDRLTEKLREEYEVLKKCLNSRK